MSANVFCDRSHLRQSVCDLLWRLPKLLVPFAVQFVSLFHVHYIFRVGFVLVGESAAGRLGVERTHLEKGAGQKS